MKPGAASCCRALRPRQEERQIRNQAQCSDTASPAQILAEKHIPRRQLQLVCVYGGLSDGKILLASAPNERLSSALALDIGAYEGSPGRRERVGAATP